MSPDGTTLFFTRDGSIFVCMLGEGGWSKPTTAPFAGEGFGEDDIHVRYRRGDVWSSPETANSRRFIDDAVAAAV